MKTIKLTKGRIALVDDVDYERINVHKWHVNEGSKAPTFYAARQSPRVNGRQTLIRMHHEILGVPSYVRIDHKNRDALDNRRSNLRVATAQQNASNRKMQCNNSSGYRGVSKHKLTHKWYAYINFKGERRHLGVFPSAMAAHRAYKHAARHLYREFCGELASC
jgi:hypothetical protein